MTTMRVVGECFFWYRLTRVFPDKFHRAVKRLCCVVCSGTTWVSHHQKEMIEWQGLQLNHMQIIICILFHTGNNASISSRNVLHAEAVQPARMLLLLCNQQHQSTLKATVCWCDGLLTPASSLGTVDIASKLLLFIIYISLVTLASSFSTLVWQPLLESTVRVAGSCWSLTAAWSHHFLFHSDFGLKFKVFA